MKFRYLFLLLIFVLPIIKITGDYQYSKTVNKEELIFYIPIVDDIEKEDTLTITVQLDVPKYYTLKQYIRNNSDCITCGDQQYVFFKNPEKETILEGDSLDIGFFKAIEEGRKKDEIVLSIITFKNVFAGEILEYEFQEEELTMIYFEKAKSEVPNFKKVGEKYVLNKGNRILCLNIICPICEQNGRVLFANIVKKNIPLWIKLEDLTKDEKLTKDFYKIIESINMKVEYKGENKKFIQLFQRH